jgi:uncharacterized protein (DUF2236 family)
MLARSLKTAITDQVVALFNDKSRGDTPVARRPDGLFGPKAVAWRVHGDVTTMMAGGVASLMLQMLHPAVLAGVWDHSNFRQDMLGRLRRTAKFIARTTFAGPDDAQAVIDHVRSVHGQVHGVLPDGTPYAADDPALLAWVHVAGATRFLKAWRRYAEPDMSAADQDRYFAEVAVVAERLGADPIPHSVAEARALIESVRPQLVYDARTREVARIVLSQRAPHPLADPLQAMVMQAGVDLLPVWARQMHGLRAPAARPLLRAGTFGLASTVRWAFDR